MSKVAINGRTLPVAPIAGGLAGIIAFAAFVVLPQPILEALVWQTRLDMIFPAAQPPLGMTARILVAIVAALAAAGLTALIAIKFAKVGSKSTTRRRRRSVRTDGVEGVRSETPRYSASAPEAEVSVAARIIPAAPPASVPTAALMDDAEPEGGEKKRSILDRLRGRKSAAEIPVEETPRLRRRDFHPDAPARRPLFADVELPGKTLDSVNTADEPASPPFSQPSTPMHQPAQRQLPAWAYEEDCDLIGARTSSETLSTTQQQEIEIAGDNAGIGQWASSTPVIPSAAETDAIVPPNSAGTGDWDDPSAFDNYIASLAEEEAAEAIESEAQPSAILPSADEQSTAPHVEEEAAALPPSPMTEVVDTAEAIASDDSSAAGKLEAQLANTPVGDNSVDELMARLQAGMARRAERRALQIEQNRFVVEEATSATSAISSVEPTPAITQHAEPTLPIAQPGSATKSMKDDASSNRENDTPAAPVNPFAAIDPLANLADKEAEVDEALRAALSTLERMNRRVG